MLHKGAWVATLLGTLLGVQDYKKVEIPGRDISSLAVKGLKPIDVGTKPCPRLKAPKIVRIDK